MEIICREIGMIRARPEPTVELKAEYAKGLTGLEGFSHIMVVWYANQLPEWNSEYLVIDKPYRLAPPKLGIFATRSPYRPNGICVSIAAVSGIDIARGTIGLHWIDAEDGTPVLDIKPYYHCTEYAAKPAYPHWCAHWPSSFEESAAFDWEGEFLFPH
jgi:tRNA (adenine37-N6)-methyltransferase